MMDRRAFVALVAACLFALPMRVATGQPAKLPRIGWVTPAATFGAAPSQRAFLEGLRDQGYVEGSDFVIEFRSTEGRSERFADLTAELVRLPVDVFVVGVCGEPLNAARRATRTIPIVVMACNDDLVGTGIVQSLNRPGGNITGLSKLTPELAAKRLELLKQTVPTVSRVAVLWNPAYSDFKADWREIRSAANRLEITLYPVEFRRADELDAAFAAIDSQHVDALITFSDQLTYLYAKRVAELAATTRLPAMFAFSEVPDAGGLMSYGPNILELCRRAGGYVAKILRGAKAGDLPIEQAEKFELAINLKTAKELGITIPQSVLLRADHVIQAD
jgi:putative ABC transport system substrate-binding protein